MNIERRVINFIFHCFLFKSNKINGGCEKYKRDAAYISIMSPLIETKECAVHDLIYRYLIYKRRYPISSPHPPQFQLGFEDVCHFRRASGNMLFQLIPKNKVNTAFRLENAHIDLERLDLIITGLIDPRWIDGSGQIFSYQVANLQFALSGRGSISRSQNEGIFNRVIKYLF